MGCLFRYIWTGVFLGGVGVSMVCAQVWSIDFENGFTATSPWAAGTPSLIGGSVSDPYNAANAVHILTDGDGAYGQVAKIGVDADTQASLYYTGLNPFALGINGKVTLDFKVSQPLSGTSTTVLFCSDYGAIGTLYWSMGINVIEGQQQAWVRSVDNITTPNLVQWTADLASPLSAGWHQAAFTWERTQARAPYPNNARERANIRMYIDGVEVLARDDAEWTLANNVNAGIGSLQTGPNLTWYQAGEVGLLIDNVTIEAYEEPPAWEQTYWEATYDDGLAATSGVLDWGGTITEPNDGVVVGTASGTHWLRYTGLAQPAGAVVSVDFTTTGAAMPACLFQVQDGPVLQTSYWWFGFYADAATTIFLVRSKSELDTVENQYAYALPIGSLPVGRHNATLWYEETAAQGGDPHARADIQLWVDGQLVIDEPGALWVPPIGTVFAVGSFYNGVSSFFPSGACLRIDNVVMKVPPGGCGAPGTEYGDGDVNRDCYVDFADLTELAGQWMQCNDPQNPRCDLSGIEYPTITIMEEDQTVTSSSPLTLSFAVPSHQLRGYLSLDGRLAFPGQNYRSGSMPCVRYVVNGFLLDDPELMINVPDARDLISPSGDCYSWIGAANNWRLPYSPDFAFFSSDSNPVELGTYPYTSVFDIGNYLLPGKTNQLQIRHYFAGYPETTMTFRNIQLLGSYSRPAADPNLRDLPEVGETPVVPQSEYDVNYSAGIVTGGGLLIGVGSEQYKVDSRYSYPNGTYNRLLANGPAAGEWTVNVIDADTVVATGGQYRLERRITRQDDHVEIADTLTNLTGHPIGIRIGHQISEPAASLQKTYKSGLRVNSKSGASYLNPSNCGNPTVYVGKQESGLGILPWDDVLRAHSNLEMSDGAYGISDYHFALDSYASYTTQWMLYPTDTMDYWRFINAVRRRLNANYLIDGALVIAHGHEGNMAGVSDEDIIRLVERNNAKYVILSTIYRMDANGNPAAPSGLEAYTHGSGLTSDWGYWSRYWLTEVVGRYRQLAPEAKLLPYIDPWVTSEPEAAGLYADSAALQANGLPQLYLNMMAVMYPTPANSYGLELNEAFDWACQNGDGYYLDESSMSENLDSGAFDYRNDIWDGHSARIDSSTYQLVRTVTSSALYTLGYRVAQHEAAQGQGKSAWYNFPPATLTESNLQGYHFVETRSNGNVAYGHLTTPLGLGNDDWERTERDLGASIRLKLLYGGLFIPYYVKYQTEGNILQDMYPITPLELHCGYVMGAEKIITRVTGEYGFGDTANLTVKFYDGGGFYLPGRTAEVRYDSVSGSTLAHVDLNADEMAIIFRDVN